MNIARCPTQAKACCYYRRFPSYLCLIPTLKKSVIVAWSSFDFAHTSYSIIMVTFVYPLYFANTIVTNGKGDLYWSIAMSTSMLIVALLGPALGAIADETSSKKKFLLVFTIVP